MDERGRREIEIIETMRSIQGYFRKVRGACLPELCPINPPGAAS
jgi:hypothetical protein